MKKQPTGKSSDEAGAVDSGSAQSAAERQSAEAQLDTLISRFAPAHLSLIGEMRMLLRKRLPTAHEVAYEYRDWFVISYSPSERGYEGVLAIRGSEEGVKLYFSRGKELPDPDKMLRGTSQTRYIDVADVSTITRPAVARLIDEAIARNPVPFASAGHGSLVVRPASIKRPKEQARD